MNLLQFIKVLRNWIELFRIKICVLQLIAYGSEFWRRWRAREWIVADVAMGLGCLLLDHFVVLIEYIVAGVKLLYYCWLNLKILLIFVCDLDVCASHLGSALPVIAFMMGQRQTWHFWLLLDKDLVLVFERMLPVIIVKAFGKSDILSHFFKLTTGVISVCEVLIVPHLQLGLIVFVFCFEELFRVDVYAGLLKNRLAKLIFHFILFLTVI